MPKLYEGRDLRKYDHGVSLPVEVLGACHNAAKKCDNWHTVLGDGLCVQCWDLQSANGNGASIKTENHYIHPKGEVIFSGSSLILWSGPQ
jgi:hypothetical protein